MSYVTFRVVIPARLKSSRLPDKPLLDLGGKPMVVRVCERAQRSGADTIVVATDSRDVRDVVRSAGFDVCMTREDHPSGTDRIAEVCDHYGWSDETVVVNVQGLKHNTLLVKQGLNVSRQIDKGWVNQIHH